MHIETLLWLGQRIPREAEGVEGIEDIRARGVVGVEIIRARGVVDGRCVRACRHGHYQ